VSPERSILKVALFPGNPAALSLAIVPLAWLWWSRKGLPGPCFRFPRDPMIRPGSWIPDGVAWLVGVGLFCLIGSLGIPDPPTRHPSTLFLVDTSASMADPTVDASAKITTKLKRGTDFLKQWIGVNPHSEERLALVRFSSMPRVVQPLTTDRLSILEGLAALEPEATPLDAETNLVDGLIEALVRVNAAPASRRLIVLWTDGEANVRANASGWSLTQVAMAIRALGVALVIADAGPPELDPSDPGFARREEAKKLLTRLAVEADGVVLDQLEAVQTLANASTTTDQTESQLLSPQVLRGLWAALGTLCLGWALGAYLRRTWLPTPTPNSSALVRSMAWFPGMAACHKRFVLLLVLALGAAGGATIFFVLGWLHQQDRLAILFDIRPGMLAGQPSRMEAARRMLERGRDLPGGADQPTGPWELWVMGNRPYRIFASTLDTPAIADEWERLEVWAEDPSLFGTATPSEKSASVFRSRVLWVSDGLFPPPDNLGRVDDLGVLNAASSSSDRLERLGMRHTFSAHPENLHRLGWWQHNFQVGQSPNDLADWMARFHHGGSLPGRLLILAVLGGFVVAMLPGIVRPKSERIHQATLVPGLSTTIALLVIGFLLPLSALGDDLSPPARASLRKAGKLLETLRETPPSERAKLLEEANQALEQAARQGAQGSTDYKTLRFLISAHQRDLKGQPSPPPTGPATDTEGNNQQKNAQPSAGETPKEKSREQEIPLPDAGKSQGGDPGPGRLIDPGEGQRPGQGLYDQVLAAQKKIARESTTRRLSRIVLRDWPPSVHPEGR